VTSEKSALESSQKFRPYKPAVVKARLPPVGLKQHGGFAVEPHLLTGSWQSPTMGQQGQKVEVYGSQQAIPEMGGSSGLVEQFHEGSSGSNTSSYLNQINWDEDEMAEIPDKGSTDQQQLYQTPQQKLKLDKKYRNCNKNCSLLLIICILGMTKVGIVDNLDKR
jgi:hypothetical protein